MLGLGLALSIAKKTLGDAIDGLLSTLSGRATYYENGSASKSTIKAIDNADVLDKATILLTPTATSNARVHSVKTYTGDEIIINGDFSNGTTGWLSGNSTLSVVDGKLKVLATNAFSYARQNVTVVSGKTYKITANFFYNSLVGNIEAYDGTTNILSEQLSEDGVITLYVKPSSTNLRLTLLNRNGSSGDFNYWDNVSVVDVSSDFDFDRASSATRINSSANIEDITSDLARINYDSNGENGHILLEPTSTNLIPYSEDFSQWTTTTAVLTPNQSSPDGSNNAYIVEDDSAVGYERVDETITTNATPHTFSVFIKKKTSAVSSYSGIQMGTGFSYVVFDSFNGTYYEHDNTNYDDVEVQDFNSNWWRLKLTATVTTSTRVALWGAISTSATNINNGATGSETFYGAQLEELPYATSYIPTLTGSTVTRATETLTGSGNSTLINSTEGVLYAEIKVPQNYGSNLNVSISDGTTSEYVKLIILTTNNIRAEIQGSSNSEQRQTSVTYDAYTKIAISYNSTEFKFFINGSQIGTTITTHTLPSGLNTLEFARGDGQANFYGKVKALAVFNEALSDTELTNLTS